MDGDVVNEDEKYYHLVNTKLYIHGNSYHDSRQPSEGQL